MTHDILCPLGDIADPGSKGFVRTVNGERRAVFVVRVGAAVFGYVNDCPHRHAPLEWTPDRFLNSDRDRILCSSHGALFRIEDGACAAGPCGGKPLTPFPVRVVDGLIVAMPPPHTTE